MSSGRSYAQRMSNTRPQNSQIYTIDEGKDLSNYNLKKISEVELNAKSNSDLYKYLAQISPEAKVDLFKLLSSQRLEEYRKYINSRFAGRRKRKRSTRRKKRRGKKNA